ncbi:MAG: phosphoribosylformylglycinamidine cyclo-ligase [Sumerlaeia bacterium]
MTNQDKLTYEKAGVSIKEGDAFVERIAAKNKGIGGFSGLFPLNVEGMKNPTLLASTDGVGTKLLIAQQLGKLDTIGIDLVAMVLNDLVVPGGLPLFFLDYYATGKLTSTEADAILEGIQAGCAQAQVPLLGGETAEMPGLYKPGHFDLAGFGVGVVDADAAIDGSAVAAGDVLIGVQSSGVHSNGYSLVRAILEHAKIELTTIPAGFEQSIGEVLLKPTIVYVELVKHLLKSLRPHAMCHITGGGLPGNLPRVLPKHLGIEITDSWEIPLIFKFLMKQGNVDLDEMYRVYNMGVGYVFVVSPAEVAEAKRLIGEKGFTCWEIGKVVADSHDVKMPEKLTLNS